MSNHLNPRPWIGFGLRISLVVGLSLSIFGCRGMTSKSPPVHIIQNMDFQDRLEAQEASDFFSDGRAMRPQVEGTIAIGYLKEDDHLYRGKDENGLVSTLPPEDDKGEKIELNREFILRGQQRFGIYCAPCHDNAGTGQGTVVERGMQQPPSLMDERIMAMPIGHYYDVITNGIRNMGAYRHQVKLRDRWAIAAYVRALQLSRTASLDEVPKADADKDKWEIQ